MADQAITVAQYIQIVALGGLLGVLGQTIRMIAGLKKFADQTGGDGGPQFSLPRLMVSLLIGAVAGAIAAYSTVSDPAQVQRETILAIIAAGYAGADFIEAFARRSLPQATPLAPQPAAAQPGASGGAAAGGKTEKPADDAGKPKPPRQPDPSTQAVG